MILDNMTSKFRDPAWSLYNVFNQSQSLFVSGMPIKHR